jgi:signal transduction histidine kinase
VTADLTDVTVVDTCTTDVLTDSHRFQQMLGNLLGNARKYGSAPFVVRLRSQDQEVHIDVEDDGDGVPEEFRPHLFQEYSRAPGTAAHGTGLGLYVVRALAESQGGRVTYRPGSPRGSVFTISLPAPPA